MLQKLGRSEKCKLQELIHSTLGDELMEVDNDSAMKRI